MPDLGVIMSSFMATRYQMYGGVFIADPTTGTGQMFSGELITDKFVSKDPDGLVLRSQSRPLLVPGNVDHTAYIVSSS
jgi:hypothetical protein